MKKPTLETFCSNAKNLFMPAILRRTRHRDAAEDIFQDVILNMITRWDQIEEPEEYFWRSISNRTKTAAAAPKKYSSIDEGSIFIQLKAPSASPVEAEAYEQYSLVLNKAINQLPSEAMKKMMTDFLLGTHYDPKKKQYVQYTVGQYCEKYNIKKSYFYEINKKVTDAMRSMLAEPIDNPIPKNTK